MRELPPDSLSGKGRVLKIVAFVDGASRENPGPAGWGAYLKTSGGETIEASGFLGKTTNNVAEYSGLLGALKLALKEGADEVEVVADSLLVVNQMRGEWRVKHPNLIPLFREAKDLSRRFKRFEIRHTPREGNGEADRLANLAVDREKGSLERFRHAG